MIAATGEARRDAGFAILDSIGSLSRNSAYTVDPVAGSALTQGVIRCMFDVTTFSPSFPTDPIYDFAPALTQSDGGAFYVRGGASGGTDTIVGATITSAGTDTTVLSGIAPPPGVNGAPQPTWADILEDNVASDGRLLIYGYQVSGPGDPLEFEWATIPPAGEFSPGAIVALCDDNSDPAAMIHESDIGVLAYSSGNPICGTKISMVLKEEGWAPRELAARLARVVRSAVTPAPLEAAVLATRSGGGGTVTTVKSVFSSEKVDTVTLAFTPDPPRTLFTKQMPYVVRVRATARVNGAVTGVNGTCIYLTGSNNNGQNTALAGNHECDNEPAGAVSVVTKSIENADGDVVAGYAEFALSVTKTGGLIIMASSTDDLGRTGVVGRDGQTFINDLVKTNVKP